MTTNPVPIRFSLAEKQALQEEADKNNSSISQTVKNLLQPFFDQQAPKSKAHSLIRLAKNLGITEEDWKEVEIKQMESPKNFKIDKS